MACSDLPVLVRVQSVEEIVTAVLPRSVRELQDRQQREVTAVFTLSQLPSRIYT